MTLIDQAFASGVIQECFKSSFTAGVIGNLVAAVVQTGATITLTGTKNFVSRLFRDSSGQLKNHHLAKAILRAQFVASRDFIDLSLDQDYGALHSFYAELNNFRFRSAFNHAQDAEIQTLRSLRQSIVSYLDEVDKVDLRSLEAVLAVSNSDASTIVSVKTEELFPAVYEDWTKRAMEQVHRMLETLAKTKLPRDFQNRLSNGQWLDIFQSAFREELKADEPARTAYFLETFDELKVTSTLNHDDIRKKVERGIDQQLQATTRLRNLIAQLQSEINSLAHAVGKGETANDRRHNELRSQITIAARESLAGNAALKLELGRVRESLRRLTANQQRTNAAIRELSQKLDAQRRNAISLDELEEQLVACADSIMRYLAPLPLKEIWNESSIPNLKVNDVFTPISIRQIDGFDIEGIVHAKELADWFGREAEHSSPEELVNKRARLRKFLESSAATSATEFISGKLVNNLVLLGEAGGGKTHLLRHLAVRWASAKFNPGKRTGEPIPIYIELKDYAQALESDRTLNLFSYCGAGCNRITKINESALIDMVTSGRAFFLLDALDEVLDRDIRATIIREIINLGVAYRCIVVTSRVADFDPTAWLEVVDHWSAYRIEPLDLEQQEMFIHRYHEALFADPIARAERVERLFNKLRDFHRMAEIAGTPLLLTLLCLVNVEPALPETRTALYEAAAKLLLHQWDFFHFAHDGAFAEFHLSPLELGEKYMIMRRLAWLLMNGKPPTKGSPELSADSANLTANIFSEEFVREAVRSVLTEINKGNVSTYERLVPQLLAQRDSLLCAYGKGNHSFIHRTFLEFFGAWAWHLEDAPWLDVNCPAGLGPLNVAPSLFDQHSNTPSWRLILILYFGRLQAVHAKPILRKLLDSCRAALRLSSSDKQASDTFETDHKLQVRKLALIRECISELPQQGRYADEKDEVDAMLFQLAGYDFEAKVTTGRRCTISTGRRSHRPNSPSITHGEPQILKSFFSSNGESLRAEALAMVHCRHPNVVRLQDFESVGEFMMLAIEFAKHGDLKSYYGKRNGQVRADALSHWLKQCLQAIVFIHRVGAVHTRISPDHILLRANNTVALTGFSACKLPGEKGYWEAKGPTDTTEYDSPELRKRANVDTRTDLYSLGLSFYVLATGRHPLAGLRGEKLENTARNLPRLESVRSDLPPNFCRVINRLMQYDADGRFSTASEALNELG